MSKGCLAINMVQATMSLSCNGLAPRFTSDSFGKKSSTASKSIQPACFCTYAKAASLSRPLSFYTSLTLSTSKCSLGALESGPSWSRRKHYEPISSARCGIRAAASGGGPAPEAEDVAIDVEAEVKNEKILVLGGNGFVGSAICRAAVEQGIEVVSLNRSGRPSTYYEPWIDDVTWISGDIFTMDWTKALEGVDTVISCVGGFGTNEQMEKINGDATVTAVNNVAGKGVVKFIFISVHDYNLPDFAKNNGYFNGKRRAESRVFEEFPDSGVVLRPGFIYGKRKVETFEVPLDIVGKPLEKFLADFKDATKFLSNLPASDLLLAPPVSVADVARAAIKAVIDEEVKGVYDIDGIKELSSSL